MKGHSANFCNKYPVFPVTALQEKPPHVLPVKSILCEAAAVGNTVFY